MGTFTTRTKGTLLKSYSSHNSEVSVFLQPYIKLEMGNVVELKVGLHCEECIKKILKAIKKLDDIETYNVDTELNKITVTGNVTTEQVIRALQKIKKTSIPWDQQDD